MDPASFLALVFFVLIIGLIWWSWDISVVAG
jgi:hypothetical protein